MTPAAEQIKKTVAAIGKADPGPPCWQWILSQRPELWAAHKAAMKADNPVQMASTFKAMVSAWRDRDGPGGLFDWQAHDRP